MAIKKMKLPIAGLTIIGALYIVSPPIVAADPEIEPFSAWCIPGKGFRYWYDVTKDRITSDGWSELDGTGFTGGAYVFQFSGGDEVTLGEKRLPIEKRNGPVMIITDWRESPTYIWTYTYIINTKLRKIVGMNAEAAEEHRTGRSHMSTASMVYDCDWRKE